MTTSQHTALSAETTFLTTEADSLANGSATAASAAYDNSSNRYLFGHFKLNLAAQGSNRSAGAVVSLYMVVASDGTNYDTVNTTTAELIGVFPLDGSALAARQRTIRNVDIPPCLFKVFAVNSTGQAFASSGTTVKAQFSSVATV